MKPSNELCPCQGDRQILDVILYSLIHQEKDSGF